MKFDSKYIATFSEPGWRQPEESGGAKHQGVSPHAENASRAPICTTGCYLPCAENALLLLLLWPSQNNTGSIVNALIEGIIWYNFHIGEHSGFCSGFCCNASVLHSSYAARLSFAIPI